MPRVALVTCADLPELDPEDAPLIPALAALGVEADATVWDDPAVPWASYDLVVIRSTWDYAPRHQEFLAWAARVPALANPVNVLRWNTDKHYLQELAGDGLPTVHTTWLEPSRNFSPRDLHNRFPAREDFVIKPAISAGSVDTGRYTATDAGSRGLAIRHAHRLLQAGRTVMVQRYLPRVDTLGESSLIFIEGEFSHAVRKGAMLEGPDEDFEGLYRTEHIAPTEPAAQELATAKGVLTFARKRIPERTERSTPLLYARVDLVPADDGSPVLMELELTEPSLFFSASPGSLDRFAKAIAARVS